MICKYSNEFEMGLYAFNIFYEKMDEESDSDDYLIIVKSTHIEKILLMVSLEANNEVSFFGTLPVSQIPFFTEKRVQLLKAINEQNIKHNMFHAYINDENEFVFSRRFQLYGSQTDSVGVILAHIDNLGEYVDSYIENIAKVLK